MANKKVLGRGLGAFFPDMDDQSNKKNPIKIYCLHIWI